MAAILAAAGTAPHAQAPAPTQSQRGGELYAKHCAQCHGVEGRDGQVFPRPLWGAGADLAKFVTAKGLLDYLLLQMPFDDPNKMSDDEKLAVAVFMLSRHGLVKAGKPLSAAETGAIALR